MKQTITVVTSLLIGLILSASPARAVTFDRGETVRVDFQGQNETRVITGNAVELTGEIDGDVYVFAQSLISKAVINGDLLGAVGTGLISGDVNGDIRMAGADLTFTSAAHNATVAANTVVFANKSKLIDVFSVAQRSEFNGETRNIHALSEQITLAGTTTENAKIKSQRVFIDPKTSFDGNLEMSAKQKPEQFDVVSVGGTREFKSLTNKNQIDPTNELIKLFWILVMVYVVRSIASLKSSIIGFVPSAKSLFIPLMSLVLIPIAAILLALTLIGLPLATILGLLWIIGLVLTKPLFALFAAEYLAHQKQWNIHLSILLTAVAIAILTHLPYLGSLFGLIILLFGWALAYHTLKELLRSKNES